MANLTFDKADTALIFGMVFLVIFAGLIIYVISQADLSGIAVTGSIDANWLFGIFTGIVIAVIGFIGITRGRQTTPDKPI
ncbi:MAG: hypothetical protein IIC67_10615 [Thaumarchaeota archaeon]|nr:hypothetical protein [Nitrososphaerota archaeon]